MIGKTRFDLYLYQNVFQRFCVIRVAATKERLLPMDPENNIRFVEMAQRSLVNYDIIAQQSEGPDRFEVTGLLTALAGIFVWIKEEYFEPKSTLILWPELADSFSSRTIPSNISRDKFSYSEIVYHIRNGVAHGNFDFSESSQMSLITIWNLSQSGRVKFMEQLRIEDLAKLARWVVFDLNSASVSTFGVEQAEGVNDDITIHKCQCGFPWLGSYPPKTCPVCNKVAQWKTSGVLSGSRIRSWTKGRKRPTGEKSQQD